MRLIYTLRYRSALSCAYHFSEEFACCIQNLRGSYNTDYFRHGLTVGEHVGYITGCYVRSGGRDVTKTVEEPKARKYPSLNHA